MKMRKNKAFTLAETLVVMGIIGVVAALTIPNLSASTGNKENVARVQKAYSTINEAFERTQAEYGNVKRWRWADGWNGNDDTDFFANRLLESLKITKNCGRTANLGCFSSSVKYLNGDGAPGDSTTDMYKTILADGSSLGIIVASGVISFYVDIDGPKKGPATFGKDIFDFYISNGGISGEKYKLLSDSSNLMENTSVSSSAWTSAFKYGSGLATWILQTGNMDYLKATNGVCQKGGKTLTLSGNTTCR